MKQLPLFLAIVFAAQLHAEDAASLGIFGIGSCHIHNRSTHDAAHWLPQMQAIGLR
jgi:hypothetical protein